MLKLLVLLFVIKVLPEIMFLNVGAVFVHVVVKNCSHWSLFKNERSIIINS